MTLRDRVGRLLGLPTGAQFDLVDAELRRARRREARARVEAEEQRRRAELAELMAREAWETLDRQARLLGGAALPLSDELCWEALFRSRQRDEER